MAVQVMQVYQMDAMNFRFLGHPSAWVVHRPHAPSSGYNHTFTGEAYTQVRCARPGHTVLLAAFSEIAVAAAELQTSAPAVVSRP